MIIKKIRHQYQRITMDQSIATQFVEESPYAASKASHQRVTSRIQRVHSRDELYIQRLEYKIKELKNTIKTNKPIVDQMKSQRKFFQKVCEKQKQKLASLDPNLIKSQYQKQIDDLKKDRQLLQEIMSGMHEQSVQKGQDFAEAKSQLLQNNQYLSSTLKELTHENQTYEKILQDKAEVLQKLEKRKQSMMEEVKNKQYFEKKYLEVLEERKRLDEEKKENCFDF